MANRESHIIDTAFILEAGLGTRLRPLTERLPKPLLPVAGRPIITYAMEHLKGIGVRRFIINTHHLADRYAHFFPEGRWGDIPLVFRHEPILLDTAGGLKNIEDLIAKDDRILVYNGDIVTDLPLAPLLEQHARRNTEVTLALRSQGPLRNVCIDSEGFICDIRDLLNQPGVKRCLFAGIYVVETSFLRRLTPGKIESIVFPLVEAIRENPKTVGGAVIDEGRWYDLGTTEEYIRLSEKGF